MLFTLYEIDNCVKILFQPYRLNHVYSYFVTDGENLILLHVNIIGTDQQSDQHLRYSLSGN